MDRPDYIEDKPELLRDVDEKTDKNIVEMAQELAKWKEQRDTADEQQKQANKMIDELSRKLAERMLEDGVDGFKVAGVGTVFITTKNCPRIIDQEEFYKHLRDNGDGAMIKETVHPMTLLGWVNEKVKSDAALPPSVDNFVLKRAVIRAASTRSKKASK